MSELSLSQMVEGVIADEIRPFLQSHGGDIEFVGIDESNNVSVRLRGACAGCPGARATLKNVVEKLLKEKLPQVKDVIPVD